MELENFKFEKIDSYELLELINEPSQEVIDLAEKIKEKTLQLDKQLLGYGVAIKQRDEKSKHIYFINYNHSIFLQGK